MEAPRYKLAYSVTGIGIENWLILAFALSLFALAILTVRSRPPKTLKEPTIVTAAFKLGFVGFSFILVLAGLSMVIEHHGYANAVATGRASTAEGVVTNFKPMPYEGHVDESFCVESVCFQYSDYRLGPGFNQTSSHGGPIRAGRRVRVGYVGGTIVRLEVAE